MARSVHRRLLDVAAPGLLAGALLLPAPTVANGHAGVANIVLVSTDVDSGTRDNTRQVAADAIEGIIRQQVDAFRRDDSITAFSFADQTIQQMFGNPNRFMGMVRSGYPMIYRAVSLEFGPLDYKGPDRALQPIGVADAQGKVWVAIYSMIRRGGQWRIGGVQVQATTSSET